MLVQKKIEVDSFNLDISWEVQVTSIGAILKMWCMFSYCSS